MRLTRKSAQPTSQGLGISRRQFLQRSGVATGGLAAAGFMGDTMMQRAQAEVKTAVS
ncbi:MAG TPA: twin-arginine translocation signal domain-containing protein, partial [Modicisalibacter sp.]|nr:twin-arginine translocation signal domain-containing protein [Modicisalibacter sp.]